MIKFAALLACAAVLALPVGAEPFVVEVPVEAAGPQGPLAGTLRHFSGAQGPVALIIPGSGPTDRDGNNPLGVRASSYRLLAEQLAAQGIISVRIDKRGLFGSAAAVPNPNSVTIADYVTDTAAWVGTIRAQTGASCVWLIGHSEGGLIALSAAQEVENLCGLVLVATAGRPLGDLLKSQLRDNPANAPLIGAADASIDQLALGRRVDTSALPRQLQPLFYPEVQGFLISAFAIDPADLIARVRLPILIVQGARDLQISVQDAERLQAASRSAELVILPHANHVLKDVASSDLPENLATYGNPDLPLSPGVAFAISNFIAR